MTRLEALEAVAKAIGEWATVRRWTAGRDECDAIDSVLRGLAALDAVPVEGPCPECMGKGTTYGQDCPRCNGTGRTT